MAVDARGDIITLTTASVTDAFVRGAPLELNTSGYVINSASEGSRHVIGFVESPLAALSVAAQRVIAVRIRGLIECTGVAPFDAGADTSIDPGDYVIARGASGYVERVVGAADISAANMNSYGGAVLGMVVSGSIIEPGAASTTGTLKIMILRM